MQRIWRYAAIVGALGLTATAGMFSAMTSPAGAANAFAEQVLNELPHWTSDVSNQSILRRLQWFRHKAEIIRRSESADENIAANWEESRLS